MNAHALQLLLRDGVHGTSACSIRKFSDFLISFSDHQIGGFISISYLGWRWTEYISAIMGFTAFGLLLIFFEETYPPIVLVNKASELRRRTKNWGIHAKQEEIEVDFKELLSKNVSRPLRMLFTEPIILVVTIYMSFIYGLLYLFLTAYALVFQGKYHFNAGISGLTYFGLVAGELIAFAGAIYDSKGYAKKLKANQNVPVPEWRIPLAIAGGISFAGGLFIQARHVREFVRKARVYLACLSLSKSFFHHPVRQVLQEALFLPQVE